MEINWLKIKRTGGKQNNYYLSLEILRGLCALEVVIWHCFSRIDDSFLKMSHVFEFVYYSFLRGSDIAIIGFFVLSGFVTTASFISYFNKYPPFKATIVFYIARMVRIWSLTFTTVLVSVAVAWHYRTISGDWSEWSRYSNFSLLSILRSMLGTSAHWNAPMWTLGYEIAFYSILPLIMLVFVWNNYAVRAAIAVTIVCIVYLFSLSRIAPIYSLYIPFVLGILIYFVKDNVTLQRFFQSNKSKSAVFFIAFISIIYLSWDYFPTQPFTINKYFFVALAVLCLVFTESFFIKHKDNKIIKILTSLSKCSYSLYLWHWLILCFTGLYMFGSMYAKSHLEIGVLFSIAIPILILVTWMSWYFIERNARMKNILPFIDEPKLLLSIFSKLKKLQS
jgi:peptidoglycan/LPS O-acetylase OafA/YrhL